MITSIMRYHTAIHYIMSITRDRFRPYWVSSGGCKKHSTINMLKKKTNLPLGAKKCNAKQYDTAIPIILFCMFYVYIVLYMYHIVSYICIILFCIAFFCTQWQICFFLAYLLLSVFYTCLMRPNKVETGRGLLT